MQVLWAVAEDLYIFAVSVLFPRRKREGRVTDELYLPASRVISPLRTVVAMEVLHEEERHMSATEHVAGENVHEEEREDVEERVIPQKTADVYPVFAVGAEYSARDAATVRLRLVIRDEFSTILSQLPLQAHEYVYYKLLRHGARIIWPNIRPRTPGSWAKILSTLEAVLVGDEPSAGAAMEMVLPRWSSDEKTEAKAHLAYVEEVFPDRSIRISEADWPSRGIYNERTLAEDEWRAFAPVFISIR